MKKKKVLRWVKIGITVYILGGMCLYFLQDYILFRPVSLKRSHAFDFSQPHRDTDIPVNEKDTINLVDFFSTDSVTRGIVLYFHGNKKHIGRYAEDVPYFTRHGYQVLMIDYPGYGKSRGKLTEKKLYDWALMVYQLAHQRFPADSIIIYGKSMGTGIAAQLASIRSCKRLILETPYYDFPSVVSHYLPVYPVKWMLHYQFPTYLYLPNVTAPIHIFHGTKDRVVPYKHTKRLKKHLKQGDEIITIQKGRHNDLYKHETAIRKLDSLLTH